MLNTEFPRDLAMLAAIFGVAAFVWAGWAQERPPSTAWRVYLAAAGLGGLVLAGFAVPVVVRRWDEGTAIEPGTAPFVAYVVWFWVEVIVAATGAVMLIRRRRSALVPALILVVVGLHFVPLAFVFAQPMLLGVAVLLTAIGASGFAVRRAMGPPSFWCGALSAPVFLAAGAWALVGATV